MKPMSYRIFSFPLLATTLAIVGCKSKEDQLVETRRTMLQKEDALYRVYGGSDVAAAVSHGARQAIPSDGANLEFASAVVAEALSNGAREVDREVFSDDCRNLGRGQRVPFLTDKGRTFFARPETVDACNEIARLADTVTRLEAELGMVPSSKSEP